MGVFEISMLAGSLACGKLLCRSTAIGPRLMMLGVLVLATSLLLLAFSFATHHFIACRLLMGLGSSMILVPAEFFMVTMDPDNRYSDMPYIGRLGGAAGYVVGPLVGGI
eukprot:SAG31_NODE_8364_length_1465_cov_1.467789_2_plen_108_part_01